MDIGAMEKHYIKAQQLLEDSFRLAWQVYESGYRPNYIVGVWRGGAPIGIAVQEFLDVLGIESDHIAIRTSSYTGIGQRSKKVKVHGLSYIIRQLESEDSLLIVDDVHDTGLSIEQAIKDLTKACKKTPQKFGLPHPTSNPKTTKQKACPITTSMKLTTGLFFNTSYTVLAPMRLGSINPN